MDHVVLDQFFARDLFRQPGEEKQKAGTEGRRRPGVEKEGVGPDQDVFAIAERPAEQHAGHAAQGALVEEGQKGAGGGEDRHGAVHVVGQVVEEGHLVDLAVFQNQRNVLDGQHDEIARETEGHFGQHRMHVGMPENKPAAQRLTDVDAQNQQRRAVADEADQHGVVDDVLQLVLADHIFEQSGEEGATAQGDHRQVGPDPEREPIIVVHVGLVQPLDPAQQHGIDAPQQHHARHDQADHEFAQGTPFNAFGYQCGIHKVRAPCSLCVNVNQPDRPIHAFRAG